MASKTKPNKRDAILDAMLDVVVERGFHEAPMSIIAERSNTSAGLIYHHFASKEAIIRALYERIYALKMASNSETNGIKPTRYGQFLFQSTFQPHYSTFTQEERWLNTSKKERTNSLKTRSHP